MEEPKLYIVKYDGTVIELDGIKRAETLEADSSKEMVMESKPTCLEYVIDSNDGLKLLLTIEGIIANSDGKYNFKAFYLKDREVQAIEFNGLDEDEFNDAVEKIHIATGVDVQLIKQKVMIAQSRYDLLEEIKRYKAELLTYKVPLIKEPKEPAQPYKSKIKYCKGYKPKQYWNRTRAKLNFKTNKKWKNRK